MKYNQVIADYRVILLKMVRLPTPYNTSLKLLLNVPMLAIVYKTAITLKWVQILDAKFG